MSPSRSFLFGGAVLLAMTFGIYADTLRNEFVDFDDNIYVTGNPVTRVGLSPAVFRYAWTTFDSDHLADLPA